MITMRLQQHPFERMKEGKQTIEMRLCDEKRSKLKVGDEIMFVNAADESEHIITKIIALHKFSDFKSLYKHFNKVSLGYEQNEVAKPEDMEIYYTKEMQKEYGVLGIEIKLQSN